VQYWDTSAPLPLFVREASSDTVAALLDRDPAIVCWSGTSIECASAIARLEREAGIDRVTARALQRRVSNAAREWSEVPAIDDVRAQAVRLLQMHPLRAAEALQLAAAIVASDFAPSKMPFVTLDLRLADAAAREGFPLPVG
jgi:predicted nucleic acid-binding protein